MQTVRRLVIWAGASLVLRFPAVLAGEGVFSAMTLSAATFWGDRLFRIAMSALMVAVLAILVWWNLRRELKSHAFDDAYYERYYNALQ